MRDEGQPVDATGGDTQFTFRPTRKHWFNEIVGPVVLYLAIAGALMAMDATMGLVFLIIIAAIAVLTLLRPAIIAAHTRLDLDGQGLRGRIDQLSFDLHWSEVSALAKAYDVRKRMILNIAAADRFYLLLLASLDADAVWRAVTQLAPAAALADDAFDRLAAVAAEKATRTALLDGTAGPVRVRVVRWIGWLGVIFAAMNCLMLFEIFGSDFPHLVSMRGFPPWLPLLFFLGVLIGLYLIYCVFALIELGSQTVRVHMPLWPTYAIRWDEVLRGETDGGSTLVLCGANKRLILPGPSFWRSDGREAGIAVFYGHLEARKIPLKTSGWAQLKTNKGTRVRRNRKMPGN